MADTGDCSEVACPECVKSNRWVTVYGNRNPKDDDRDAEIERLKKWVDDLQSGIYVNCVYCGYRYGYSEDIPVSMAEVLKEHVESCPKHPMNRLKLDLEQARRDIMFLLSFAPKDVPDGLDPTFYFTLSYEGDKALHARIAEIRDNILRG